VGHRLFYSKKGESTRNATLVLQWLELDLGGRIHDYVLRDPWFELQSTFSRDCDEDCGRALRIGHNHFRDRQELPGITRPLGVIEAALGFFEYLLCLSRSKISSSSSSAWLEKYNAARQIEEHEKSAVKTRNSDSGDTVFGTTRPNPLQ
jgi:hypothetical protein